MQVAERARDVGVLQVAVLDATLEGGTADQGLQVMTCSARVSNASAISTEFGKAGE